MKNIEAKVVVVGPQEVGKTSITVRYVTGNVKDKVKSTVGASYFTTKMTIEDYKVKLLIWDTAGQERFKSMAPMFYRNANAALLVFDITSYRSFVDLQCWVTELRRNVTEPVVMCLLGNKIDLKDKREVKYEDALNYAASIGVEYFETSVITNEGIDDSFTALVITLIKTAQAIALQKLQALELVSPTLSIPPDSPKLKLKPVKCEDSRPQLCC